MNWQPTRLKRLASKEAVFKVISESYGSWYGYKITCFLFRTLYETLSVTVTIIVSGPVNCVSYMIKQIIYFTKMFLKFAVKNKVVKALNT